jgi:hypothetical protein
MSRDAAVDGHLPGGPGGRDRDDELRVALEELQAGRWLAMATMLARSDVGWELRTERTKALALVAYRSNVTSTWISEQPDNADARVMHARAMVERALRAGRQQRGEVRELEDLARSACETASRMAPADPVPWVDLIALAELDGRQDRPEHRVPAPERSLLSPGPWGLLAESHRRHPFNREAYHRMLRFWHAMPGDVGLGRGVDYVRWVSSWVPVSSPLSVLPLYAYVEQYRRQRDAGRLDPLLRRQWDRGHIADDVARSLAWFDQLAAHPASLLDLNHLAHALWAGSRFEDAGRVFTAIGPFAVRLPWAHVADRPELAEREFQWARRQCLKGRRAPVRHRART